jgi:hypothetical protein
LISGGGKEEKEGEKEEKEGEITVSLDFRKREGGEGG